MDFVRRFRKLKTDPVSTSGLISDTGLTLVSNPDDGDIGVDVVFVHGFTGHPEKTWTFQGGRTPPTYWPRDRVPQSLPKARVWTFGYDADFNHPFRSESQNTVYGEGKELVASLNDVRPENEKQRPIIFVAHSLGGIVVKQALRYSEKCKAQPANRTLGLIFDSVTGILFFGTPHGGADPRDLNHHILQSLVGIAGVRPNANTLTTLLPNSAELEQLRDEFLPMARKNQWVIVSFQEQRGVVFLNGKLVVDKVSSCLGDRDIESTRAIDKNHMDMCKFSQEDPEYRKVDQALKHIWEISTTQSQAKTSRRISEKQRQLFFSTLWWPAMNSRENAIEETSTETVQWIFDDQIVFSSGSNKLISIDAGNPSTHTTNCFYETGNENRFNNGIFRVWLESSESVFWMRGKAGSGKSTIMKYLSHEQRTQKYLRNWKPCVIILRFFFIEVTTDPLQRRLEGCFRSLLHQLLHSDNMALHKIFQSQPLLPKKTSEHDWSAKELQETLIDALQQSDNAFCLFIDGLDEIQSKDQSSAVRLMETLANIQNVKVCVSSREENALLALRIYPSLRVQDLSRDGILAYVQKKLYPCFRFLDDLEDKSSDFKVRYLIKSLVDKGDGIFLWIELAVRSLLRGIENGDSFQTLLERTNEFAPGLDALFQQMWSRQNIDHDLYRQESAKLFWLMLNDQHDPDRWRTTFMGNLFLTNIPIHQDIMELLCAKRPPTIQYIRSAMKEHAKWLLSRSAGLIELQSHISTFLEHRTDETLALPMPKQFEVKLIHKSVREYLLNTTSGRAILHHDTRKLQHKWVEVINALKTTAIFSMVYRTNMFEDFNWGIPSLLPENNITSACSAFTGLLACHTAMGHISTDNELTLLNDFAETVRIIAHPRKLQFPIFMCAAAYGASQYLSQHRERICDKLTVDEKNTILFSACDSFQTHMKLSQDIPADWGNFMETEEWNIFAIRMIRRSIDAIKYMLLANANPDAIFSTRVNGPENSTTPFFTFLRQLFMAISDLARNDYRPNGLYENEIYAMELTGFYREIGACIDLFTNRSKLNGRITLDDRDYGRFCLITKPSYRDPKNVFEISVNWFVEFFKARKAFFEDMSQGLDRPGSHGRSEYVKCIGLRRREEAGSWNNLSKVASAETLELEEAFEALLWNRAAWRYETDRLYPAETRELDRRFEIVRDQALEVIYV